MYYLMWLLGGHWALATETMAVWARTVAAVSWAVAAVLVTSAVVMPGAASTATTVVLLPLSGAPVVAMVALVRPLLVLPSTLVVVVMVPAMIVAGLLLVAVCRVSLMSAPADIVGPVVVFTAPIIVSFALPTIVCLVRSMVGVVIAMAMLLILVVGHCDFF